MGFVFIVLSLMAVERSKEPYGIKKRTQTNDLFRCSIS